jgi:hypothetical protein
MPLKQGPDHVLHSYYYSWLPEQLDFVVLVIYPGGAYTPKRRDPVLGHQTLDQ